MRRLQAKVDDLEIELETRSSLLAFKDERVKALSEELGGFAREHAAMAENLAALRSEQVIGGTKDVVIEALRAELDQVRAAAEMEATSMADETESKIRSAEAKAEAAESTLRKLRKDLRGARDRVTELEGEVATLKGEKESAVKAVKSARAGLARKARALEAAQGKLEKSESEGERLAEVEDALARAKNQLRALNGRVEARNKAVEEWKGRAGEWKAQVEASAEEVEGKRVVLSLMSRILGLLVPRDRVDDLMESIKSGSGEGVWKEARQALEARMAHLADTTLASAEEQRAAAGLVDVEEEKLVGLVGLVEKQATQLKEAYVMVKREREEYEKVIEEMRTELLQQAS